MAALLSAQTSRAAVNPRSWEMATKPRPSAAPFTIPASSASPKLRAMVLLLRRPMLDGVRASHARSPAGGPP
eukprot:2426501-Alexandrium_andersonii.AAC.1